MLGDDRQEFDDGYTLNLDATFEDGRTTGQQDSLNESTSPTVKNI